MFYLQRISNSKYSPSSGYSRNVLLSLSLILYLISYLIPQYLHIEGDTKIDCPNHIFESVDLTCDSLESQHRSMFYLYKGNVTKTEEFIAIIGMALPISNEKRVNVEFDVYIFGVDSQLQRYETIIKKKRVSLQHNCEELKNGFCDKKEILHLSPLHFDGYIVVLSFVSYRSFKNSRISDYAVSFYSANPNATNLVLIFRYILLIVSVLGYIKFVRDSKSVHSIERSRVKFLAVFLIIFNDPFAYLVNQKFSVAVILEVILTSAFIWSLFYFWNSTLDDIQNKSNTTRNKFNFFMSGLQASTILISYLLVAFDNLNDPLSFWDNENSSAFKTAKAYLWAATFATYTTILFKYFYAYNSLKAKKSMNDDFLEITGYYMFIMAVFILSGSLQIINNSTTKHVLFYGMTNNYVLYIMFNHKIENDNFQFTSIKADSSETKSLDNSLAQIDASIEDLPSERD